MTQFSPFDTTLWHATATRAPDTGPLEGTVRTDVCVVGGGYTGMTSAIELRRRGHEVVLLEAQEAGFGGSGRNAGHCTPTFSYYSLEELRTHLGTERANRLIARQTKGADMAAEFIRDFQISCEWKQNGYFQGALSPSRMDGIRKKADSYASVGCPSTVVDAAEARRLTGSDRFFGGWLLKSGGHLNPLGYARGLARAVLQEGAQLFTRSKVSKVERQGDKWHVRTDSGEVIADKVIMATGAYTDGGWNGLEKTYRIQKVMLAATSILPEDVRAQVIPFDGTMHDGRGDIFVYKYNAEGRIVASMFPVGKRGRDLEYTRQMLMDRLRWLHPQVPGGTTWDYFWTGELDMQRHTIPRLYDLGPGALACTGLSGRGVPTGTMLGGILADWAEGTAEMDLALPVERLKAAPPYMSFAPEMMLRWYGIKDNFSARRDGVELPPHA
ncbi:NAD(P)/FAD-dependent oxidoreductase [Salipiger bermudensis]|uniref:Oxidoreductase n=1 Tax=Salipiger bermudensis (strain DSM 26914 / JCM 13377 / KCTC 12554 / HTCC2601) TaxID=314265 RepID=Q0FPT6_SALBH|nr:FAD-dependent oxidoreductase [Salipiger bermudensis]EAU46127.1 oxidoreductase [Salipiger bermudensis HTCC2601]